jgi:tripartite-type tricarboxylate transporter receptor subunit TctC
VNCAASRAQIIRIREDKEMKWARTLAATAAIMGAFTAGALANNVNFAGKTVNVIVPYTEGGGTDLYARLFVPYLRKHLPGNPTVVIRNMPGGGSIMGSNYFHANAKPDGLSIVATSSSTLVAQLFAGKKREFDVLKWRQFIVSPQGTVAYVTTKTGASGKDQVADIQKLRGQKLKYGSKQPDAGELRVILAFELLAMNVDTVFGLARGEVRQAMMRNELELNHDTAETYLVNGEKMRKDGLIVPLFTLGYPKGDNIVRDPAFPDMMTASELYEKLNGKKPSGPLYEAYKSFVNLGVAASKGFALPTGTPDEIRDVYVAAMKKTLDDPDFKKASGDEVGDYPQLFGNDADYAIKQAVDLSPETNKWLTDFLFKKYGFKA